MDRRTMDKKIVKLEKNVAAQAIIPPQKVYDYMKGWGSKKVVESKAERQEINRLFFEWAQRTCELLKSKAVSLSQVLDVIPKSPWRSAFIEALVKGVDEAKRKK